jgi:hypothetical protein
MEALLCQIAADRYISIVEWNSRYYNYYLLFELRNRLKAHRQHKQLLSLIIKTSGFIK